MIVHVIGRAGSGKTTIIAKVVESINKERGDTPLGACLASPWNSRTSVALMQAPAVMLAPKFLFPALRLRRFVINPSKKRGLLNLMLGLSSERWRQLRHPPDRIIFVDQGLTFWLNGLRESWTKEDLSALPLPDFVLQITVSRETSFERRVLREKPPGSRELLYGTRRKGYLEERALGLSQKGRQASEIRDLIEAWNLRCCIPPLGPEQVDSLLAEAAIKIKEESEKRCDGPEQQIERSRTLRLAYEGLGIEWIIMNNDEDADLNYLVSGIARRILDSKKLKRSHRKGNHTS